jgi:Glycosyltransferase
MEAFAVGTPVVATRIGPPASMVIPGETGFHFAPGSVSELRERVEWCSRNLDRMRAMRGKARQAFEASYTGDSNAEMLLGIYRERRKPPDVLRGLDRESGFCLRCPAGLIT